MIHNIVKGIVNVMDAGGDSFSFGHTQKSVQNIVSDEMSLPVVFLDMPVKFTPEVTGSNFIKYNFQCNIVILYKSNIDDAGGFNDSTGTIAEQNQIEIFEKALAAQNQFINLLPKSIDVKSYSMGQSFQVQHIFDSELSGIAFTCTIEPKNYSGVCVDGLFPTTNCIDSLYTIEDEDGTILYNGSLSQGENLTAIIQNSIVTDSNGTTLAEILSQQNYEVSDSTAIVKNSEGTTQSTTSILAEGTETITANDATVSVKNSEGTVIDASSYPSGTSSDLTLPDIEIHVNYGDTTEIINSPVYDEININFTL